MLNWIQEIDALVKQHQEVFFQDLAEIMTIPSVKGVPQVDAPFGGGPRQALEATLSLAKRYGFRTATIDHAVGYAQWGDKGPYIGIVGHLDVVPAGEGWDYPPFDVTIHNQRAYGRGILDNKGPIFACLFGMRLLKQAGYQVKQPIRIIFGTDEESGASDLPLYLAKEPPPVFGFTPDCKYPVVYGERGIVDYELTTSFSPEQLQHISTIQGDQASDHVPDELTTIVHGKQLTAKGVRTPANAPELGINAIPLLAQQLMQQTAFKQELRCYFHWIYTSFHQQHFGEGINVPFADQDSGKLLVTPYKWEKQLDAFALSFTIRYPVTFAEEEVTESLSQALPKNSTLKITRRIKGTHFPKEHPYVQVLSDVYKQLTSYNSSPVTTTGATYARWMPNIVAYGPSFPGQKGIAHTSNEFMDVADLLLNMKIYMLAMLQLGNRTIK